jgi:hypothetical protein
MGKQLTGNRTKKMATGGKASQSKSKSSTSKSVSSRPAPSSNKSKTGGSAAGKTISTSNSRPNAGGGRGLLGGIGDAVRNIGQNFKSSLKPSPTVTDPKTGQSFDRPNYRGLSMKGLTSTDPANVARNREAAARYAAQDAARARMESGGARRGAEQKAALTDSSTPPVTPTVPTTSTAVAPGRGMMMPPSTYRPGIDPEWNYRTQPTVAMKKGGKVKPRGKK